MGVSCLRRNIEFILPRVSIVVVLQERHEVFLQDKRAVFMHASL